MGKWLDRFSRILSIPLELALAHPKRVAALSIPLIGACALAIPGIRTELRIYDWIDPGFPSTLKLHRMREAFGDGNSVLLLFSARSGARPLTQGELCAIEAWTHSEESSSPELLEINSPLRLRRPKLNADRLWYPKVVDLDCPRVAESGASAANRPRPLRELKATPWAASATDSLGNDLAVEAVFRDAEVETRFGKFDPIVIGALLESARKALGQTGPEVEVQLSGRMSFEYYFRELMIHDAFLNPLLLVLFILFFRVFYGTWRSGLLFSASLIVTALIVYGVMSWVGAPVDLLTNNLFLMLSVAAAEDFLLVTFHQARHRMDWVASFRELAVPCFFTTLTTVIGFLSLEVSDLRMVRRFGVWSAVAALTEWLVIFGWLPAMSALIKRPDWVQSAKAWKGDWLLRLEKVSLGKTATWTAALLFFGGIVGFYHLNYDDSPARNFPASHPNSKAYRYLSSSRGWEGVLYLVFEPGSSVAPVLERARKDPNIAGIENPGELVSYHTQDFDPLTRDLVMRDLSSTRLYQRSISEDGLERATLFLRSQDLRELRSTVGRMESLCLGQGCWISGENAVFLEYSDRVISTLVDSFLLSLALVALVLMGLAYARGVAGGWALLFSSFWGPVAMMGALAAFKVPIGVVTSMFAAVLVGLTGDNAIQYLFAARGGDLATGVKARAGSSVQLTLLLALGSSVFLGLTLKPMRQLGYLFFFGFLATLAGDLWLLKGLLERKTRT